MSHFFRLWGAALGMVCCLDQALFANRNMGFESAIQKPSYQIRISKKSVEEFGYQASTLVISCVDFRLRDETEQLMREQLGLLDDYDELVLPGASLALTAEDYPHWRKTAEDVIGLLEKLHHISQVIILDHRDCGAYKLVKGKEHALDRATETHVHQLEFQKVRGVLKKRFPHLKVYTLIMGMDGVVENLKGEEREEKEYIK